MQIDLSSSMICVATGVTPQCPAVSCFVFVVVSFVYTLLSFVFRYDYAESTAIDYAVNYPESQPSRESRARLNQPTLSKSLGTSHPCVFRQDHRKEPGLHDTHVNACDSLESRDRFAQEVGRVPLSVQAGGRCCPSARAAPDRRTSTHWLPSCWSRAISKHHVAEMTINSP